MSTPHYFIAIPLPKELKETLSSWQAELKEHVTYKQWPHVEDLHITLKFLGAVEQDELIELSGSLKEIENYPSFQTVVTSIGTFGKHDKPRVLWAGVDKSDALQALQSKVDQCAELVGLPKENRPFRPHITLAKKWAGIEGINLNEIREKYAEHQYHLWIDQIVIYQIFPSKKPKYKAINTYQLVRGE